VSGKERVPGLFVVISVASVLVVCAGLRAFRIGGLPLWVDEVFSLNVAHQDSISDWLRYQIHDANPPLSYLALKAWLLLGDGTKHLRMLPLLFSLLASVALFFIARSLCGFWVGLFALAIFALHPFAIYYGREIRHPIMSAFFALPLLYAFVQILQGRRFLPYLMYFHLRCAAVVDALL